MKRFIAFLLTFVMLVSFAGCSFFGPKRDITRGEIDDGVYTNEYLGFEFARPALGWRYSTDSEIAALMNTTAKELLGNDFKDVLENNVGTYDMMIVDSTTGTNISVMYENLKKNNATGITIRKYVESVKTQVSSAGITAEFSDKFDRVKLGSTEFTRVTSVVKMNGVTMTQVYYLHKADGFMSVIIATITYGYTIPQIEAMFKEIPE